MATLQGVNTKTHTRYRLIGILLDPNTSEYDVAVKLVVDGKTIHKPREIKKGQILSWTDLHLPFNVEQTSKVTIQVIEDRTFRKAISQVSWRATECVDKNVMSAKADKEGYTVELRLMDKQTAELAYIEAVSKAKRMEAQSSGVEKSARIGVAFSKLLKLGSTITDQDPTGGAKAAFLACMLAWEHMEVQEAQEAMLDDLVQGLAGMAPTVESVKKLADNELTQTVGEMMELIEDVSNFIITYKSGSSLKRAVRSMIDSSAQDSIDKYRNTFKRLSKQFDTRLMVQLLQETRVANIKKAFDVLGSSERASYSYTNDCLLGTRTTVIDQVIDWVQGQDGGSRLAWLFGRAGLGKSSVASSVCQMLYERDALACSFFCKRDEPELRNPRNVLAAIVRGLARRWEAYRDAAGAVLEKDPETASQRVVPMFDSLVRKPLIGLVNAPRSGASFVFVVDALDECGDVGTRKQLLTCLRDMSQLVPGAMMLVTSRNSPDIRDSFDSYRASYRAFDLEQYDAGPDIRTYVYNRLDELQTPTGWPRDGAEQIWTLSAGLFIYARTACRFIADGYEPVKRLNLILTEESWGDIDSLYTTTLRAALQGVAPDNAEYMQLFLGAVVTTSSCAPLRAGDLAALLRSNVPEHRMKQLLHSLSSFVYDDQRLNGALRISHPSFVEYITNEIRSNGLCVDTKRYNALIALRCLEVMRDSLQFNICELETSGMFNSDVPDLKARVSKALPPHVVYSCRYWSSHVVKAESEEVVVAVAEFLSTPTLLYWMEALSLLGELGVAPASLDEVARCSDPAMVTQCQPMASDAHRFVLAFYEPISKSTPHLYISALVFAPERSMVSQRMRTKFPRIAVATGGVEEQWSPCVRTIEAPNAVHGVAYSPDGRRIVSCSAELVCVWDAQTGELVLGPLSGHSQAVSCVAYSPDSRHVVSGSKDNTVRVWDAETGESVCEPMHGHVGGVRSAAYSPCGRRVVSGSDDNTIRVWNAETSELVLEPLQGHQHSVLCVAYSPNGSRIASGSADHTVRIWHARTGDLVLYIPHDYTGKFMLYVGVWSVAYSPDSHHIATGSSDSMVYVWDAETGEAVLGPLYGHSQPVGSVAYSPDGCHVVSGSNDRTVRVWDIVTGTLVSGCLLGHLDEVLCVAYSPDGRHIASGSSDATIRFWDASADMTLLRIQQGHMDRVACVAFSPDGRHIASGSDDSTVHVWDAQTGGSVLGPLQGHSDCVTSVAYSPDGSRLASGSADQTVHVWDTTTGVAILKLMHNSSVFSVVYSPKGDRIAFGSSDHTVWIRDGATGEIVFGPLQGHSDLVRRVAFSPNGRHLVSGSDDKTVRVWDTDTGTMVLGPLYSHSSEVASVSYLPDGRHIVSISRDSTVHAWDVETGGMTTTPLQPGYKPLFWLAYSPDGRYIAHEFYKQTIQVCDIDTGGRLGILQGHSHGPSSITYSPDGSCIASGAEDNTVRVWSLDTDTGSLSPARGGLRPTYRAEYSSDGCNTGAGAAGCKLRTSDSESTTLQSGACPPIASSGIKSLVLRHYFNGDRLIVHMSQLVHHLDPRHPGWVVTPDHQLLLWLPTHLRVIDSSLFSIGTSGVHHPIEVDMTDFVHGAGWLSIINPI